MSSQNKPIAVRHIEPFCVPVHRGGGSSESVLLYPLGSVATPVSESDLRKLGEFIYANRGVSEDCIEGTGFSREAFFGHEETPSDLLAQFANWVRDNGVTSYEVCVGIDLAMGLISATRTTTKKAA